jgi:hypothetical protein
MDEGPAVEADLELRLTAPRSLSREAAERRSVRFSHERLQRSMSILSTSFCLESKFSMMKFSMVRQKAIMT